MLQYFTHLLTMSSITQEDGFTEVIARSVKPVAHLRFQASLSQAGKPGSSEPPLGTSVRPKPNLKNKILVILNGVDGKFKNWRSIMGELKQYYLPLKFLRSRNYPKVIS